MIQASLAASLARRLPFYYGWVILGVVCCVSIARIGPAVATLSVFVGPMTAEFGWSRTEISGAVSLGGILAAITSPMLGSFLDRKGPRTILLMAVLTTGITILLLSQIGNLAAFYLLFCIARMNFAGPFDLGTLGAVVNWFVARRPLAFAMAMVGQTVGLTVMPLIAFGAMAHGGWRAGWIAVGLTVLAVGFLPTWLFMVGRPEELDLAPDQAEAGTATKPAEAAEIEPSFTRSEALATSTFWLLAIFTMLVWPVQAGVSLHQAVHFTERGMSLSAAVTGVTIFSVSSGVAALLLGLILRRIGVRIGLILAACGMAIGALFIENVSKPSDVVLAGCIFGSSLGALHTCLPVAWADYFGRRNFGAIRGIALTIQVTAQAAGPLLSGVLRDWTGSYTASHMTFAALAGIAILIACLIKAPRPPIRAA
ncbi:MAG TPA: MFS transporter [Hyphomicrobiaceae bacterium]|nr:MFS transporter [Hyphomicrobiaceae bacterium]